MIFLYIISGISILLGIGIRVFKWGFLIAGYNTMSKEKKKNIDKDGLCIATGNFIIILGFMVLISGIAQIQGYRVISSFVMTGILPITFIFVIIAQKYDHNKKSKSDRTELKVIIGFLIFITLAVGVFLLYGAQKPKVNIFEDRINIKSGIYRSSLTKDEIIDISLEESIPRIIKKINGFDLGYILRGSFELEELGRGKIYIHNNKSPYLVIKTQGDFYIINYKNPSETQDLYKEILNSD